MHKTSVHQIIPFKLLGTDSSNHDFSLNFIIETGLHVVIISCVDVMTNIGRT